MTLDTDPFDIQLQAFVPIDLSGLDRLPLLDRFESKYLFGEDQLPEVLALLTERYYILEIDGLRSFQYLSHYFDTADFQLYKDHHNGYGGRMKVRQRLYCDSGQMFFEVKRKYAELRTDKQRITIDQLNNTLSTDQESIVRTERFEVSELACRLSNTFRRITLCDKEGKERVTVDRNISFTHAGQNCSFPRIVVLELKQARMKPGSPAIAAMKKLHIFETAFSKYAVGAATLYPALKQNNLKPVFIKLQRYAAKRING